MSFLFITGFCELKLISFWRSRDGESSFFSITKSKTVFLAAGISRSRDPQFKLDRQILINYQLSVTKISN